MEWQRRHCRSQAGNVNNMLFKALPLVGLAVCTLGLLCVLCGFPADFSSAEFLGGVLFLQILIVALWKYRECFFPLLILIFLWAGTDVPLREIWAFGRWFVLIGGAVVGFVAYLKHTHHHFGFFHLVALSAGLVAMISAYQSLHPTVALLKAGSLLILFVYAASGARLAIIGREARFFSGLLIACEFLIYASGISYFIFHFPFFGNPNSLGVVMGVVVTPLMVWGVMATERVVERHRRCVGLAVSLLLLFSSYSRAGILAASVSSVLLCIALRRYRSLITGAAATALLAVLVATVLPPRPDENSNVVDAFLYKGQRGHLLISRKSIWDETTSTIRQHPWFGAGLGTNTTSSDILNESVFKSSTQTTKEHGSSYLAILEGVGLLGVLPFYTLLLLISTNIARVFRRVWRTDGPLSPALPVAVVLLAGLIGGAFEDWIFGVGYYACVFFWSFAFVLADLVPAEAPALSPSAVIIGPWRNGFAAIPQADHAPLY
jgi:O-antigen ligase